MAATVYIETTIPAYYCDSRASIAPDIARTREWWDQERSSYICFTSAVTIDELSQAPNPTRDKCLVLIEGMPLLALEPPVVEIAEAYQTHRLMPGPPVRDALHVALACYYRVDYLLTWNCKHIANANKVRHLETLNARLGLSTPLLVTPHLLRPLEQEP